LIIIHFVNPNIRRAGIMALKRWEPARGMEKFFEDVFEESFPSRFIKRFPRFKWMTEVETVWPAVDMYDKADEIVVKAEVPGIDKKNIKISVSGNTLTIKGEMKKEEEVKEEDYYFSERSYGSFSRSLTLPAKVVESKISAEFKDGILEVCLPKAAESKPKEIKVEVK
jgi:HSP20 family protein